MTLNFDSLSPTELAKVLLANFSFAEIEPARPWIASAVTPAVIDALRAEVDAHKHHDPQRAMQIAQVASAVAELTGDPFAIASANWAKATAHVFLFQLNDALTYFRQAEAIFAQNHCWLELVGVQAPMVYVLNALGQQPAALTLAESARQRCTTMGQAGLAPLVNLEMNVGTILIQQGNYADSLAACDRASAAATQLSDRSALARIDINRANVLQELDRYAEAEVCYRRARTALVESNQNKQQVALVDLNLGLLAIRRGQYLPALRHLESARSNFTPVAHIAWVDFNRALVYSKLNLHEETYQLAQGAAQVLGTAGSKREVAMALQVQASAAQCLNQRDEATNLLRQASQIFSELGAQSMAMQIELTLLEMTVTDQGRRKKDEGRGITIPLQRGLGNEASVLTDDTMTNDTTTDITKFTKLHSLIDEAIWPNLATRLALLEAEVDPNQALERIDQSLTLLGNFGDAELTLRAHRLRSRVLDQQGDHSAAWQSMLATIASVHRMRHDLTLDELQIGLIEEHLPIFEEATTILGQTTAGYEQLVYLQSLATTSPRMHQPGESNSAMHGQLEQLTNLRGEWHWQQHKLEQLLQSAQSAEQSAPHIQEIQLKLTATERQMADLWRRVGLGSDTPSTPRSTHNRGWDSASFSNDAHLFNQQLHSSLQADEALLLFVQSAEGLQVYVIDSTEIQQRSLGSTQPIESALRAWRHHLHDWALIHSKPAVAAHVALRPLRVLYQQLFAPLQPILTGKRHLYLVLPPAWSDMPVAALRDDQAYLHEHWSITLLASLTSLVETHATAFVPRPEFPPALRATLVGYSHHGALQSAVDEACQVADSLSARWHTDLLIEGQATSEAFLESVGDSDLIHLATHAHFRSDNPIFSWLQLADARLPVAELYQRTTLPRTPLVVLSACETARGQRSGLIGLARAWLAVGASQLIATQWRVEDASTAQLMRHFYQQWVDEPTQDASSFLQQAQQALAHSLHPAYWAGFVHIR